MSLRSKDWHDFSDLVHNHIEEYTIPQYGDKGDDLADDYTPEECIKYIQKYVKRHGSNVREGQTTLDLIKIAHYAQLAYTLITKGK
jgi:hypothetical protein